MTILFVHFFGLLIHAYTDALIVTNFDYDNVIVMHLGKPLLIQCNTTDMQDLPIQWSKDNSPLELRENIFLENDNHTLHILSVELNDVGEYTCSTGIEDRSIQTHLAPHLDLFHKSLNLVEGDTLRLHCRAEGVPKPIITWYIEGELLTPNPSHEELNDSRIRFLSDEKGNQDAILMINQVTLDDRAMYSCLASSPAGSANSTILVRVKDRYAALWPFLGIVIEVVLLCALILIYERRRSRSQDEDSEAEPTSAMITKSSQDHSGEVRQRK